MAGPKRQKTVGKRKAKLSRAKDNETADQVATSIATLSRVLVVLMSVLVAIAAVLLKPMFTDSKYLWAGSNDRSSLSDEALSRQEIVNSHQQSNSSQWAPADPRVGFLFSKACQKIHCHGGLQVSKRFFRATQNIEPGEILFEIPRSWQLWDLDALRDPWIRLHLFGASHGLSGNRVGSEAFLAAYLVIQMKKAKDEFDFDPLELAYFDVLPKDFRNNHPALADKDAMKALLGASEAQSILQAYHDMIASEYLAFSTFSKRFEELITEEEYTMARMNVLTRAIHVGLPGPEEALKGSFLKKDYTDEQILNDELGAYNDLLGIDLREQGCSALIPLADLLNHHSKNNVEYAYVPREQKSDSTFVVKAANRPIEQGSEPFVSYGDLTNAHLYAKYGFVNGDGSSPNQVSLAFHHDVLRLDTANQYEYLPRSGMTMKFLDALLRPMASYLRFDDGYEECIPGPVTHPDESDLKLLKHKHLLKITHLPHRWKFKIPPQNPNVFPKQTHEAPFTRKLPVPKPEDVSENIDLESVRSTCRLITLIDSDYDGKAAKILSDNLDKEDFALGPGNESLEYRSWMCIRRWTSARLSSHPLQPQMDHGSAACFS